MTADYLKRYQAWRRGEDDRTMSEAGLAPQGIGEAIDAVLAGFARYEKLRRLSPREYQSLWLQSINGDVSFDDLVDKL